VRLNPRTRKDGIVVVGGRAEKWMDISYDNKELPLLPKDNRLSLLVTEHAHQKSHLGVSATTATVRLEYWIPNLQRIAKTIKNKCVTCKRLDKSFAEQRMASLPVQRLKPALPWLHTSIDLFGPFTTRGEVNKRSRGKAYGIIFNCMVNRGVHIDLATDYSTEGFLLPFRRFVSMRGYPKEVYSDNGTQLSAASKELQNVISDLDQQQLKEFGAEMGLEWHFSSPDGPWRNGCSESLIKSVKRGLNIAVGEQILSFSELQTVCFEVAVQLVAILQNQKMEVISAPITFYSVEPHPVFRLVHSKNQLTSRKGLNWFNRSQILFGADGQETSSQVC